MDPETRLDLELSSHNAANIYYHENSVAKCRTLDLPKSMLEITKYQHSMRTFEMSIKFKIQNQFTQALIWRIHNEYIR